MPIALETALLAALSLAQVSTPYVLVSVSAFHFFFIDDLAGRVSRVTPSQDVTEAGTPRKRAQRACRECHAHKTKCSGSLPICARCTNLGINCIYEPSKRKFSSAPGSAASEPTKTSYHALTPPDTLRGTTTIMETKQLVSPTTSSLSPGPLASTRRTSLTHHLCVECVPPPHSLSTSFLSNKGRSPSSEPCATRHFSCAQWVSDNQSTTISHFARNSLLYRGPQMLTSLI